MNTDTSASQSGSAKLISFFGQTTIVGIVIGGLLSATASPIHAWWFDSAQPKRAIAPTHHSGLVLSPLIKSMVPQFVLEPLSTTEVETPPSTDKTEAKPTPTRNAVVLTPNTPQASPTPQVQSVSASSFATQMLESVNAERTKRGLTTLKLNAQLTRSAQDYALRMQQQNFFSHTSPDGGTFRQRNEAAGYTNWQWMGENIAYGQPSVAEVMKDWMNSDGHRANILEPRARELGVGYVGGSRPYWVQEFGAQF